MTQVVFLVLPHAELLDVAGPAQTFSEANDLGGTFQLRYCGIQPEIKTGQGMSLSQLEPHQEIVLQEGDLLFVSGVSRHAYTPTALKTLNPALWEWLHHSHKAGASICSICTGAFVLAFAGLLNGRFCTTHWQRTEYLQELYPQAKVLNNRLFIEDQGIFTSAGIASGIDLALAILERRMGAKFTAMVARMLVVYMRRDGSAQQQSIYLAHRSHISSTIHEIQDWLIAHPDQPYTLETLAEQIHISPRHLTRLFKQATGITIKTYTTRIKLEHAKTLLYNPHLTVEEVAKQCGFKDARQLRRLWQTYFGLSISQEKIRQKSSP